jgi:hypothetical protein
MSENTINIGDMVKHKYNTSEEQAKTIGIVVDISKATWDDELMLCYVDWLNSPYRTTGRNGHVKGYRFNDLEKA